MQSNSSANNVRAGQCRDYEVHAAHGELAPANNRMNGDGYAARNRGIAGPLRGPESAAKRSVVQATACRRKTLNNSTDSQRQEADKGAIAPPEFVTDFHICNKGYKCNHQSIVTARSIREQSESDALKMVFRTLINCGIGTIEPNVRKSIYPYMNAWACGKWPNPQSHSKEGEGQK